eukprot:8125327-Pyramimonas_sp.AAC.1
MGSRTEPIQPVHATPDGLHSYSFALKESMTVAFTKPLGSTRPIPQSHYAVAPSGVPRQQQCGVTPSGTARPRPSQQVSLLPRDL